MTDLAAALAAHPFFAGVRAPGPGPGVRLGRWTKGQVLFRQGEPSVGLILIVRGSVRVFRMSPEGRRQVLHQESDGGSLGEVPLLDGGGMTGTAMAVEPTSALVLPSDTFRRMLATSPDLALHVLGHLARRVRGLAERLESVSTRRVQARLAAVLLARARRSTDPVFSIGMTQHELAEELGTVREVVGRELRVMAALGAIKVIGGGRYRVGTPKVLETLAGEAAGQKSQPPLPRRARLDHP